MGCGLGDRKARVMAAKAACKEDPSEDWGQGTRRAHINHVGHVCDAGRVETQRLVERRRTLPSRKGVASVGARCRLGDRNAQVTAAKAACTGKTQAETWLHARAERTENM